MLESEPTRFLRHLEQTTKIMLNAIPNKNVEFTKLTKDEKIIARRVIRLLQKLERI